MSTGSCPDSSTDATHSYVAALELRIEKLERRLAYARSRKASVAMHESDVPPPTVADTERKDSLATIRAAIHRKAARKRENSDVNSLVSDFGYLYVKAMSALHCMFTDYTSDPSMPRRAILSLQSAT